MADDKKKDEAKKDLPKEKELKSEDMDKVSGGVFVEACATGKH